MAQAEGTSKNEGRVSPSTSGASKGSSSKSSSSSQKSSSSSSKSASSAPSKSSGFSSSGITGALSGLGKALGSAFGNTAAGATKAASSLSSGVNKATNISSPKSATAKKDSLGTTVSKSFGGLTDSLSSIGSNVGKGFGLSLGKLVESKSKNPVRDFSGFKDPVAKEIATTWSNLGWSNKAIAVGLGNAKQESSFNPKARNKGDAKDGSDSVGLFQHNSARLAGLDRYAKNGDPERNIPAGADPYSPTVQASYVDYEMKTSHTRAWDAINNAPDVATASDAWANKFEVANPSANKTRQGYSNQFSRAMDELGIEDITGFDNEIKGSIAAIENLGKPVGSKPSQYNSDPFGIGTVISSALGLQSPSVGRQKNGAYVDPAVSSVEGRQKRGEEGVTTGGGVKRSGLAGIAQKAAQGKPGALVDIAKAATNPVEFALNTIMDFGNQTRGMNTPGPEGEGGDYSQNGFGLGFLKSFLNGDGSGGAGGFAPSEKGGGNGQSFETAQATQGIAAPENAPSVSNPVFTPVTPLTPPVLTPERKPFGWSLL